MAIDLIGGRKKPVPRTQRASLNRAKQLKRDDTIQDISVSLMDMDSAIMYYFENVIKPTVIENGETIKVPTMYASPERWFAVQNSGFMRDAKRQVMLPAIAFRRTGMEKDETISVDKMDPEEPKLHYTFERKYTQLNRYDNFSVQQGILPQREFYNVAVPDYMVLTYDFMIWTHYIEQMNKLVERINWSAGAYWGEPNKMRFRTNIDSYTDSTEVSDKERIVRTEFSVTLRGYLIPEAFNELAGPHIVQQHITPSQISIGTETDIPVASLMDQIEGGETLSSVAASVGSTPIPTVTLNNALSLTSGLGITITNEGESFNGSSDLSHEISIPQDVSTTSIPEFSAVTASSILMGSSTLTGTSMTASSFQFGSDVTAIGNLTVNGNSTIKGTLIAQELHSEVVSASIIFSSGSTRFGNTIDDNHYFTGSMYVSGSWAINGYSIDEISNDTSLTSNSTTALVTENAAKTYTDNTVSAGASTSTYLRKQYVKISTGLVSTNTASFSAVTASAPEGVTSTTEHDFLFFINGQYMEHDAIEIQQASSTLYLKVDTDSIGYDLESDDEILAWGKFNS
jgi:hypothetical protein